MRANFVSDIVSVIETELNGYGTTSSLSRRKCKKLEQDSIYDSFAPNNSRSTFTYWDFMIIIPPNIFT
ncbi:MAG: hypothetical protein QN650_08450 [Nitrososphaeraceae archaeon]|nr:hypothetical protein [Nitrososphaeraceae archaeon]